MNKESIALWMQSKLTEDNCLYQDDIVDYLVKSENESFLNENIDGNLVINRIILNEFKKLNKDTVVWVRPDKYWRFRVKEDEEGRNARG